MQRVLVFCGSSPGRLPESVEAAQALGRELASRGLGLVYGGAEIGVMGAIADAVLAQGGEVIGIIPRLLLAKELAHTGVADMRIVETMHERKALMESLADAIIALPGGFGTLEELFEILTWAQLGIHTKPVALLNVAGYWDRLLALIDHMVDERFLRDVQRDALLIGTDPGELLDRMSGFQPPSQDKWLDRSRT
jgi:uncharacterized protein (TIGR00730 family)